MATQDQIINLVIDTNILRAAGNEDATEEQSIACRQLLKKVLTDKRYGVVISASIRQEYNKHKSKTAHDWLFNMQRQKRQLDLGNYSSKLRTAVKGSALVEKARTEMAKDVHLVEAALATDKRIISRDDKARGYFANLSVPVIKIRKIIWVSLSTNERDEQVIQWLDGGALAEKHRTLEAFREKLLKR